MLKAEWARQENTIWRYWLMVIGVTAEIEKALSVIGYIISVYLRNLRIIRYFGFCDLA